METVLRSGTDQYLVRSNVFSLLSNCARRPSEQRNVTLQRYGNQKMTCIYSVKLEGWKWLIAAHWNVHENVPLLDVLSELLAEIHHWILNLTSSFLALHQHVTGLIIFYILVTRVKFDYTVLIPFSSVSDCDENADSPKVLSGKKWGEYCFWSLFYRGL